MCRRLIILVLALAPVLPVAAEVDHGVFSRVLARHVADGRVAYGRLRGDTDFSAYLQALQNATPADLDTDARRKAFYLNAFNACVLKGVIDHWPVTQVVKVPGFLDRLKYRLAGRELTLDQIENEILRPMGDPRVHAALVNGARSAPRLREEAYLSARLDAQLDDQARRWVNDAQRNRLDRAGRKLALSKVFDWYRTDFERVGGAAGFVKQYVTADADRAWLGTGDYQIEYLRFNWEINAQ